MGGEVKRSIHVARQVKDEKEGLGREKREKDLEQKTKGQEEHEGLEE